MYSLLFVSLSLVETPYSFCYARILGIYHANAIYTGLQLKTISLIALNSFGSYWFELVNQPLGRNITLKILQFVSMVGNNVFWLVDPANVIWSCHLIPAFAFGRLHPDQVAISSSAQDEDDWKQYYVNQWVIYLGHIYISMLV
ncbi:hypothetical protein HD554DRAFT_2020936 [Boletus coccyginus]|nr:hypothetical protein HD554DRAFT_2020936 [Boletus coccyginus]